MKRFWDKVDIKSKDECWEWRAAISSSGYGSFGFKEKVQLAHRVSYELTNGSIPDGEGYHGMCVCHSCDNKSCVNPSHLFLGTQKENIKDMFKKGREVRGLNKGERAGSAKLKEVDIVNIRAIYKYTKVSQYRLANIYSVAQSAISKIVLRKSWKHVA